MPPGASGPSSDPARRSQAGRVVPRLALAALIALHGWARLPATAAAVAGAITSR